MPYYIYGRNALDALFVFVSNGSVILYNYRSVSFIKDPVVYGFIFRTYSTVQYNEDSNFV